jgi:hypothetical protein
MFIFLLGGSRALALLGRKVLEEAEYWKRLVVCSFCVCVCVCVCVCMTTIATKPLNICFSLSKED